MALLEKAIRKQPITDDDIAEELFEVCDREHAGCSNNCPMFDLLTKEQKEKSECPFFKSGHKMLTKLREVHTHI